MHKAMLNLTLGVTSAAALILGCNGGGSEDGTSTETSTETDTGDGDGDTGDGDGDSGDGDGDSGDGDGDTGACTPGEIVCADGVAQICEDDGTLTEDPCADECVDDLGCVLCLPGTTSCMGDAVNICSDDGSAWQQGELCDPLQGLSCDEGACAGACAEISGGFLGCDYYPTVTASAWQFPNVPFKLGVVVANGNDEGTDVCFTRGGSDVCDDMGYVGPNTVVSFALDDVPELKAGDVTNMVEPSVLIEAGAYRVRTDLPVAVYQFNPATEGYASADASLLFPTRAWDTEYVVISRNHWVYQNGLFEFPGFYAVVARDQDTEVTISPSSTGAWVGPGAGIESDGTGQVTLHRGDVLEVFSWRENGLDYAFEVPSDLTGTRISATKPIQVIGGSKCANVPFDVSFCDRLEDSLVPVSLASDTYVVSAPVQPSTMGMALARRMVRIVAIEDDTGLSYNPAIPGAPTDIAYAGDYVEFDATESFTINASKNVMVAEYMTGSGFGGGGDPSMSLAMPTSGFLSEYLIFAPTNYNENWINVVFDKDTVIELDGVTTINQNGSEQLGFSDWRIKRVPLSNAGDGTHRLVVEDGGMPFGLSVYGYGGNVSYWYPGGLDLPVR